MRLSNIRSQLILTLVLCGCATSQPLMQSFGNPNLLNFQGFRLVNMSPASSPEFLRDNEILQHLGLELLARGYRFASAHKEAQYLFSIDFVDQVNQVYIPPVTRIQTVALPDTTTNFSGGATYAYNPFNTIQYSGSATTSGRSSAVAITSGGYYVNQYGVGVAMNVYDAKTGGVVWSGVGGERANPTDPVAAANRIIDSLLDKSKGDSPHRGQVMR